MLFKGNVNHTQQSLHHCRSGFINQIDNYAAFCYSVVWLTGRCDSTCFPCHDITPSHLLKSTLKPVVSIPGCGLKVLKALSQRQQNQQCLWGLTSRAALQAVTCWQCPDQSQACTVSSSSSSLTAGQLSIRLFPGTELQESQVIVKRIYAWSSIAICVLIGLLWQHCKREVTGFCNAAFSNS